VSASSFFLAYILSPRNQKHPYLLWTTLFIAGNAFTDSILSFIVTKPPTIPSVVKTRDRKGKGRQMDASYEVLGHDSNSEGTMSGEEVWQQMDRFKLSQIVRTAFAGIGFAMSIVGIWGDGVVNPVNSEM